MTGAIEIMPLAVKVALWVLGVGFLLFVPSWLFGKYGLLKLYCLSTGICGLIAVTLLIISVGGLSNPVPLLIMWVVVVAGLLYMRGL